MFQQLAWTMTSFLPISTGDYCIIKCFLTLKLFKMSQKLIIAQKTEIVLLYLKSCRHIKFKRMLSGPQNENYQINLTSLQKKTNGRKTITIFFLQILLHGRYCFPQSLMKRSTLRTVIPEPKLVWILTLVWPTTAQILSFAKTLLQLTAPCFCPNWTTKRCLCSQ